MQVQHNVMDQAGLEANLVSQESVALHDSSLQHGAEPEAKGSSKLLGCGHQHEQT